MDFKVSYMGFSELPDELLDGVFGLVAGKFIITAITAVEPS